MDLKNTPKNLSEESEGEVWHHNYFKEMGIALIIVGLLINVSLLVKIKYGEALVTRLTYGPYKVSLYLLILMFVR